MKTVSTVLAALTVLCLVSCAGGPETSPTAPVTTSATPAPVAAPIASETATQPPAKTAPPETVEATEADYSEFLAGYKKVLAEGLERPVEQQRSDAEAIALADDACASLDAGASSGDLALGYAMDPSVTEDMAGDYIAILAAAELICPQP